MPRLILTWPVSMIEAQRIVGLNQTRVLLRQPALPHYRLPIFRSLANEPDIVLRVIYGKSAEIANVAPEGLDGIELPYYQRHVPLIGEAYTDPGFRARVKDFEPDVVVMPWNARQRDMGGHLRWLRTRRVGSVLWGHGYSKHEKLWRRWLRNHMARRADAILLYNQTAARRLINEGFSADRVVVAPNALDQTVNQQVREYWQEHPDQLTELARRYDLVDRKIVLFVSRLDSANRLDLLIKALPTIVNRTPTATLLIVGGGDIERDRLESLTQQLGVVDHVRFTGPVYDPREVGGLMSLGDVFCYPRNIGLSILHAFAFGLPVVTSDQTESQNPEIESLREGVNGRLYRDHDAHDLARVITDCLQDNSMRQQLSLESLRTAHEIYTPRAMIDGMLNAIKVAVSRSASLS